MRAARVALLLLLVAGAAQAQTAPIDSAALEARVRDISSRLRCPVCLNLSIADSPSELARDMVAVVRDHLKRGESEEQIRAFFEARYGEWVHMKPPAHGFNLFVWLLPAVVVVGGGALVVFAVRRWVKNAQAVAASAGAPAPVSDEYLRKVEEELARNDLD